MRAAARLAAVMALAAFASASCSDPPKCSTADCTIPGETIIKWEFDNEPTLGFNDDSCGDVGAITIHVEAVNPGDGSAGQVSDTQCGNGQTTFSGLEAGMYNISVTPEDINGTSLVKAPVTTMIAAAQPNLTTTATVEVPYTAWTTAYTGTFLWFLKWGGQSCAAATPPVVRQVVTLTAGGQVVTAAASNGQKLDGTDPEACYDTATQQFPQSVDGIPFGPATLTVTGLDGSGSAAFEDTFQTFVGAAKNNPTLTFDVLAPGMDAGVQDAGSAMDAGSGIDAGSGSGSA